MAKRLQQSLKIKLKNRQLQYKLAIAATFLGLFTITFFLYEMVGHATKSKAEINPDAPKATENGLNGFDARQALFFNSSYKNPSPLFQFPVLVKFKSEGLKSIQKGGLIRTADGSDICFTKSDGKSLIPHQIDRIDLQKGIITAWVKLDTILPGAQQSIYCYYGSASYRHIHQTKPFAEFYQAIYHLNSDFENQITSGENSFKNYGLTDEEGKISGAKFSGARETTGAVLHQTPKELHNLSCMLWIKPDGLSKESAIITSKSGKSGFRLFTDNKGQLVAEIMDKNGNVLASEGNPKGIILPNTWSQIAFTYQSYTGQLNVYINGQLAGHAKSNTRALIIGDLQLASDAFKTAKAFQGTLDELRIANTALSAEWLLMEFNNQNKPDEFIQSGVHKAEETSPMANLLHFDAEIKSSHISISWTVSHDEQVNVYTLERSMDGMVYEALENRLSKSKAGGAESHYFIIDNRPKEGFISYRLKMTDFDNNIDYSQTISVKYSLEDSWLNISQAEPNPFHQKFKVNIHSRETGYLDVKLTSVTGKLVHQEKMEIPQGESIYTFQDKQNLKPGLYFLSFARNDDNKTIKLVKQTP